jgi:hypothetical protein
VSVTQVTKQNSLATASWVNSQYPQILNIYKNAYLYEGSAHVRLRTDLAPITLFTNPDPTLIITNFQNTHPDIKTMSNILLIIYQTKDLKMPTYKMY